MKRLFGKKLQCSYTVEAALLSPVFIGIIVLVIYMGIYLYNRSVLQEIANYSTQKAVSCQKEQEEMLQQAETVFQKKRMGHLFSVQKIQSKASVSNKSVTITVTGFVNVPVNHILKEFTGQNQWKIKVYAKAVFTKPVNFIRKVRTIEHAGGT